MIGASTVTAQTALVLNEFNAVDDLQTLENDTANDGGDSFWGSQTQGNGANWLELVVTLDHADLRNWKLEWSNADPDSGSFTFTNNSIWSNVRSGTIITIREDDATPGGTGALSTNTSFNPAQGDWWIHVNVDDPAYVSQSGFKVDNDAWQATIKDGDGNVKYGPIGEGLNPVNGWGGSGINSREVGAQTLNPSSTVSGAGFQDLDYSTFGEPNYYNDPASGALIGTQDFSALQTWWTNRIGGDANVDGTVNSDDFNILATNFGIGGQDWFSADFTGDGTVNSDDFNILATNFGLTAGADGVVDAGDWASLAAAVPEPACIGLFALAAGALAGRRRRD
jgi:hypothetical protein